MSAANSLSLIEKARNWTICGVETLGFQVPPPDSLQQCLQGLPLSAILGPQEAAARMALCMAVPASPNAIPPDGAVRREEGLGSGLAHFSIRESPACWRLRLLPALRAARRGPDNSGLVHILHLELCICGHASFDRLLHFLHLLSLALVQQVHALIQRHQRLRDARGVPHPLQPKPDDVQDFSIGHLQDMLHQTPQSSEQRRGGAHLVIAW